MPLFLASTLLTAAALLVLLERMDLLWVLGVLACLLIVSGLRYFVVFPIGIYAWIASDEATQILGIDIALVARLSKWLGIAAVLLLVMRGLLTRAFNLPHRSAWWFVGFGLWSALTAMWSVDPNRSQDTLITVFGLVLLSVALSINRLSDDELAFLREIIVVGGALVAITGLYAYFSGQFESDEFERSTVARLGSWSVNANGLTTSMFLPFAFSLYGTVLSRSLLHRAWSYAAFAAMLCAAVLAQSRAGLFGMMVILLFITWRLKRTRLGIWAILAIIVIASWGVLEERFTGKDFWRGGGRWPIWTTGLEALESSWTVGDGFGTFWSTYKFDAHNIYLQMGIEVGVIGLGLFVAAVLSLLGGLRSIRSQTPGPIPAAYLEAALVGFLSYGFFHGILVLKLFWMAVGLAMLVTLREAAAVQPEEEGIKTELPILVAVEGEWRQR